MKIRRCIYLLRNKKVKWEEKWAQMSFFFFYKKSPKNMNNFFKQNPFFIVWWNITWPFCEIYMYDCFTERKKASLTALNCCVKVLCTSPHEPSETTL